MPDKRNESRRSINYYPEGAMTIFTKKKKVTPGMKPPYKNA